MPEISGIEFTVMRDIFNRRADRKPLHPYSDADMGHIWQVGEIVYAWNTAHNVLYRIFTVLAAGWDEELAYELWHSHASDNAQRLLMRAIALRAPTLSLENSILWAIAALDDLAKHRNDAIHLPPMPGFSKITPDASTKKATLGRLETSPIEKHWKRLRGDLYAISNYLTGVQFALYFANPRTLTHKPKLLLARTTTERSQNRTRQAKKLARERQRQSSQA